MIANIGPADYNLDESLSTLRYASRAKHIEKQQENEPQNNNEEAGIENEKPEPFSNFKTNVKTGKDLLDEWARKYKSQQQA